MRYNVQSELNRRYEIEREHCAIQDTLDACWYVEVNEEISPRWFMGGYWRDYLES